MSKKQILSGVDVLLGSGVAQLKNRNVGLITNHTGVTRDLETTSKALCKAGIAVKALFAPEHGIHGDVQDAIRIKDSVDNTLGVPVHSVFGRTYSPTIQTAEDIDTLVYDIQDVGARCFTYIYTMAYGLEFAAEHDLQFVVLDRPIPFTDAHVEGVPVAARFRSFVGDYGLPLRYGLTVGELALYLNRTQGWKADLDIVSLSGWRRDRWYDETDLPWTMPSPNLPTLETAVVFPGTVLLEGTNISEGRGTTRPFELIGAPWLDTAKITEKIREGLENAGITGVLVREALFSPTFDKHAGTPCHGFQLHVTDRNIYAPVGAGIVCLKVLHDEAPEAFKWLHDPKALLHDHHDLPQPKGDETFYVDKLAGTDALRKMIDQGASLAEILERMTEGAADFGKQSEFCHLYD